VGQLYSSGVWIAKPGHEAEFAAAWREFASWSLSAIEGASWAVLLQDRSQSNRFVSFGPWDSLEAMAAWRAHPGFAERVAEIRPLIERLEPSTLEAVAEVGTGPKSG
jgi:quinol monooxygenase YgiN